MSGSSSVFFGVEIPEALLATELQNHDAASLSEARTLAGRALATKAVLLARADALDVVATPERNAQGQDETDEEARIRCVLSAEVEVDPPSNDRLRAIYDANPEGFQSPPLLEASHILVAPADTSETASANAQSEAANIIATLQQSPGQFGRIAANKSACPSAADGGLLGQLRPGDVLEDIWNVLIELSIGEVAGQPVQTEHGWHVLRLDHRAEPARLPFDHVRPHISAQVEARNWTVAAAHYVERLLSESSTDRSLKLTNTGSLDDGLSKPQQASTVLGSALSDMPMALAGLSEQSKPIVDNAAKLQSTSPDEILRRAISNFLKSADDEAWTKIISRMRDSDAPLPDCLDVIVAHELPSQTPKRTLILQPGGRAAAAQEKGHTHGIGK